jgi:hypothetical protein
MKILKHSTLLLILIVLFAASCKKNGYDLPNAKCLVTHTDEDLYGTSLDITYNANGDPAAMSFSGFPATVEYDTRSRLVKVNFGSAGVHFDYEYSNNTFLPAVLKYVRPDFNGIVGIDSFRYNIAGQMIKRISSNLLNPAYNFAQTYQYNNRGNVVKVIAAAQNGGTIYNPAVTVFEATRYDNRYNFMSGNQWIKYLLFYSDEEDYAYSLFSVNNTMDWKWGYNDGSVYSVTSTLNYNSAGFATTVNGHLFDTDGVTELVAFTRNNISTCDAPAAKSLQRPSPSSNRLHLPANFNHIPTTLSNQ